MRPTAAAECMSEHTRADSLRVSFISQWYAPELGDGGIPRGIATALRDRGHDVEVLTGFPNYPRGRLYPGYRLRPYQREILDGLTIHRAPLCYSHDTNAKHRAANYLSFAAASTAVGLTRLRRADVSLVYSSPITAAVPAMAMRSLRRTPYVLLIQDMWPQSVMASGFLTNDQAQRVERSLHRFCDRVYRGAAQIAVSSPGMMDLVADRGIPRKKIHIVPNWADERNYYPAQRSDRLRNELGLTRRFTVMYAGNLGESQGLDAVLDAAALLRARNDIGFALVGHGAAEESLRATATARKLDNVVFVPPQPVQRMAEVLATADLQMVSLKDEAIFRCTLPSKVQTLLAAGRPILGFVAGDAAHVIEESGAGVIASPGRPDLLAAQIDELSALPQGSLEAMGGAGRRHYESTFAADVAIQRLGGVLRAAAGAHHPDCRTSGIRRSKVA